VNAFAAAHPHKARLLGWEHVLGDWGAAVLAGDSAGAKSRLDLAGKLGAALERRRGDASLADAVRTIRAAAPDRAATRTLAQAHRAYASAQEWYRRYSVEVARDPFSRVVDIQPPSPMLVAWATAFRGAVQVHHGNYAEANAIFVTLLSRVDSVRHGALLARVQWMHASSLLRMGRYPEARSQYEAAAESFRRIGETEFLGAVLSMAGETAYLQGDTLAAYRALHQALQALRAYRSSTWLHALLLNLGLFSTVDQMPWAAAAIQEEDLAVARHLPGSLFLEALLGRARVRAMAGHVDAASRDLNTAAPLVDRLEPGIARDQMAARLRFVRSTLNSQRGNLPSLAALDSAVTDFADNGIWLLPALLQRADARLAAGEAASAAADLDIVTERIRGLSRQEEVLVLRASIIEEARSRFDQLVMLHVNAGRYGEALRVLERGRISFAPSPHARVPADRGEPVAPPGEIAVEYALIGDTLLTWTVRGRDVRLVRDTVDRDEFLRTVERVGAALESPSPTPSVPPELARLYDWLVRPVKDGFGAPDMPLVILADGEVAGVPFAVLLDTARKKFLIEDHPLRFAVSLEDAARPVRAAAVPVGRALLVADPAFDRHRHPTLHRLRGARAEVGSLGLLYPRNRVILEGGSATREAFIAQAERATLIHYAGHAVFDDARPERSFLVLAGDGTSGQLATAAVDSLSLSAARLVVLSACRTLRSRDGRSGGFAGLSGALLAAGAGGVVGSVWNVSDGRAQPLMVAFHREYRKSGDPARALRTAQLQMLRSPDPRQRSLAAWAGFRYAGAAAPSRSGAR
jgi:CHAT domain-containing protein